MSLTKEDKKWLVKLVADALYMAVGKSIAEQFKSDELEELEAENESSDTGRT